MRLSTQISLLVTLITMLACSVLSTVVIRVFHVPSVVLLLVLPIGAVAFFLSLLIAHFCTQPFRDLSLKVAAYRNGDKTVDFNEPSNVVEATRLSHDLNEYITLSEARLDELTSLKERQDTFVSDVAHELRTPLTAISGNAEIMLDPDMPPATRNHFCEIILTESNRLKNLVNSLLELQHISRDSVTDNVTRLNPKAIALEVVDLMQPLTQDKHIQLTVEGEAPDILGNADRLKEALINLVDNAIRHVDDEGNIRIMLSGVKDQSLIAVKDNGCGIGIEDTTLLFKRFFRTDASRARNTGGSGLGLSIVKEIVESFDGTISAYDAPEGGAVFIMSFPSIQ